MSKQSLTWNADGSVTVPAGLVVRCHACGHALTVRCPSCSGRKGGKTKSDAKTAAGKANAALRWARVREERARMAAEAQGRVQAAIPDLGPDSREVGSCPACAGSLGGILRREPDGQTRCQACGHMAYC